MHVLLAPHTCDRRSLIQVSLPSQLERDSGGGSSSDVSAPSSSASSTSNHSQKFPIPPVHRDIQRITATTNATRRGMHHQLSVMLKTLSFSCIWKLFGWILWGTNAHRYWSASCALHDCSHCQFHGSRCFCFMKWLEDLLCYWGLATALSTRLKFFYLCLSMHIMAPYWGVFLLVVTLCTVI